MIIIGGCDFDNHKCYNDVFSLDLSKFPYEWSELPSSTGLKPSGREGFGLLIDRNKAFLFSGCNENGLCYKETYLMQITGKCIFKCPLNAVYVNGNCQCKKGFSGKNCDFPSKNCKFDCNGHGICNKYGECECYDNFFGKSCESSFCIDNCGGNSNGFCNVEEMRCECKKNFFGPNCRGNCAKTCSLNGYCLDSKVNFFFHKLYLLFNYNVFSYYFQIYYKSEFKIFFCFRNILL